VKHAKADGMAVGHDLTDRKWYAEVSGWTADGEVIRVQMTPEQVVALVCELLAVAPETLRGTAGADLVARVEGRPGEQPRRGRQR
jgi:hypothetical protein